MKNNDVTGMNENDVAKMKDQIPQTEEEITDFLLKNEKMIYAIINEYRTSGIELDDMKQEASIGFLKGIRTYSPKKGTRLTTYCYKCAKNQVLMMIRKNNSKGRRCTCLVSIDEAFSPNGKDGEVSPLNAMTNTAGDSLHMAEDTVEEQVMNKELAHQALACAQECLTELEYNALIRWYNNETQEQISTALDISQATASKLIHYAHSKLKWYLQQKGYFSYKNEGKTDKRKIENREAS